MFTLYGHGGHLDHVTWIVYVYTQVLPAYRCFTLNLVLIGQAVSEEMFEFYGNIHVYCPRVRADEC